MSAVTELLAFVRDRLDIIRTEDLSVAACLDRVLTEFSNQGLDSINCPNCDSPTMQFKDPQEQKHGSIRQESWCAKCKESFVDTYEHVSRMRLAVDGPTDDLSARKV